MYELIPPDLPRLMRDGEVHRITHGPMTLDAVLARGLEQMDEEDRLELYRADPIAYYRARLPRSLLGRLLHGKG